MKADTSHDAQPLIMYLDIDAFFPSVEQARFPDLCGKPVIVGSGVVASSSYEARRYGISAGTPIAHALRLCPGTIVLKGHQHTYSSFARHIFDHCRRITPSLEVYLDETFCDLTGTPASRNDLVGLGQGLKAAIRRDLGLTVTIGFGSNRMVAKLAAKDVKPDGLAIVASGDEEDFMSERAISDIPGIGSKATELLHGINVRKVRHLKHFPIRYLEKVFGKTAFLIYERLRGRDPHVPSRVPRSISRETSFPRDTIDLGEALSVLYYLTERACRATRGLGLLARRVQVKVRYGDGLLETRSGSLSGSHVIDVSVFAVASRLFAAMTRRCSIRLVGIALSGLVPARDRQEVLYPELSHRRLAGLCETLDDIRQRFGHSSVIAGRSINLINRLERDTYGYILRTPSLTK
jgi:DNA polymerase-4